MRVLAGICAAQTSFPMGFDPLTSSPKLQDPDTLLHRAVTAARDFNTHVVLPPKNHPNTAARETTIGRYTTSSYACDDHSFTQSLQLLAKEARGFDGLMVLLPNMPLITTTHTSALLQRFSQLEGQWIVRACDPAGKLGYPMIFPAFCLDDFEALQLDESENSISQKHGVMTLEFPSEAAIFMIDTAEDWDQI